MGSDPSSANFEVKVHPRRDATSQRHMSSPSDPPAVNDRNFSLFRRWLPWLVPTFVGANIVLFILTMYVNDCPKHSFTGSSSCVAPFLGRFSFQPLKENPLLGPSSSTSVLVSFISKNTFFFYFCHLSYIFTTTNG